MAPPGWTSPEQAEFLLSFMADYFDAQKKSNFTRFWVNLFEKWEAKYPTKEQLFPEKQSELNEEEQVKLTAALQAKCAQLQTWYRWRSTPKARAADKQSSKLDDILDAGSRSHLPHRSQIYSKLYWDSKLKTVIENELPEKKWARGEKMAARNKLIQKLWDEEKDEGIKAAVEEHLAQLIKECEKGSSEELMHTPQQYAEALKDLPGFVGRVLHSLQNRTGWCFSVLMGGPDPTINGDINVTSFHVGENGAGLTFGNAHPHFERDYMEPFTDFLLHVYPEDVRRTRALEAESTSACKGEVQEEVQVEVKGDIASGKPVIKASPALAPSTASDNILPVVSPNAPATLAVSPTAPVISAVPASTALSLITPLVSAVPAATTSSLIAPVISAVSTATTSDPIAPVISTVPTPTAFSPITPVVSTVTAVTTSGPIAPVISPVPATTPLDPPIPATVNKDSGSNHRVPPGPYNFDFLHNGPTEAHLTSYLNDFLTAFNTDQAVGNGADNFSIETNPLTDFNWDLTSGFFSQLNASSRQSSTAHDLDSHVITQNPTLPSVLGSTISPPVPSLSFNQTVVPLLPTPSTPIVSVPPTLPSPSLPTGPSPPLPSPTSTSPEGANKPLDPVPTNDEVPRSRSGRHLTASKRAEEMNKIGTACKSSPTGKENIAPGTVPERPEWRIAAEAHLLLMDLGENWVKCVNAWIALENTIISNSKVGLPVKHRPEEWQKWTAKSIQGNRVYTATSVIDDPLEFGYAIMSWWKHLQPDFRQSADVLPAAVYNPSNADAENVDHWSLLRKGGPNGLISLLTLLLWWGQALSRRSQWQEDSRPFWDRTVDDVRLCLEKMISVPTATKRKRGPATYQPSKRVKKLT